MSTEKKVLPSLWQISNDTKIVYAFAENPSEALKIAETECIILEDFTMSIVCSADEIINCKL